ncbi:hypothetical protein DMP06_05585 [Slackia equolifaciens]|uniref:Uncharacterized protein n=1 Tax=Slackia equolifaciens TaxID=498718 RepID=A0A3N0AZV3_9ACTN|nr:hypothetical protein DMP06_05585 [Slackia equolifaciens]
MEQRETHIQKESVAELWRQKLVLHIRNDFRIITNPPQGRAASKPSKAQANSKTPKHRQEQIFRFLKKVLDTGRAAR